MNYRKQIEESNTFKAMDSFKLKIYSKASNINSISEHLVIAKNIGLESWLFEHNPNKVEIAVIKELI